MTRKKILFFIVEGVSEHSALVYMLEKIFSNQKVLVQIADGDITSDKFTTPLNVPTKITDLIKSHLNNSFKPKDFVEVIQLVDMDGVFINEDKVLHEDCNKPIYKEESIKCKNIESIRERNRKKSAILNRLISLPKVWKTIPYSVYFFSCNLDHVLHDEANLNDIQKNKMAMDFAIKYKDDSKGFISFFKENTFSLTDGYNNSWDFIKLNENSLKRYSNFGLIFTKNAKNICLLPDESKAEGE